MGMVLGEDAFGMLPGGDSLRWKAFGMFSGWDAFGRGYFWVEMLSGGML